MILPSKPCSQQVWFQKVVKNALNSSFSIQKSHSLIRLFWNFCISQMIKSRVTLVYFLFFWCTDHISRFAIYIPLFLPISVPIFFSSMAALKWLGAVFKAKSKAGTERNQVKPTDSPGHKEYIDKKEVHSEPETTPENET